MEASEIITIRTLTRIYETKHKRGRSSLRNKTWSFQGAKMMQLITLLSKKEQRLVFNFTVFRINVLLQIDGSLGSFPPA